MSLQFDFFQVDPKPIPSQIPGFEEAHGSATWPPSTSTYIWDDRGGLLVDTLITLPEAGRLASWVKGHSGPLTNVYITHPHGDHLLGLPAILDAYPDARAVALADSIEDMRGQTDHAFLEVWGSFFPGQLTDRPVIPDPLVGTEIGIGDASAQLVPVGGSDTVHSSVVFVPELGLAVPGDVVYNRVHMWMYQSTPESRAEWLRALDAVQTIGATTLIAGHRHPQAPDDDANRQIDESRQYILDFEAALAASTTPQELVARMEAAYPEFGNPYTLWLAAYTLMS
ncbi:MBL fold metallo-hydrolase [Arthrobacter sp. NPDC056691]|uniref:MBL fold metallo-hydrolase n=1 Tax=Arthrobacter sp. NPDC056691 TaxID=3345913 RepID=UPI003672BEEB